MNYKKKQKTREVAIQIIYSWKIFKYKKNIKQKIKDFKKIKPKIFNEIDLLYLKKIIKGINKNIKYIKNIISSNIYKKTKYIGNIEYAILYIAIYELKINKKLPYKVIINESILLSKKFGYLNSYKLINKIIHNIYIKNKYI